MFLQSNMEQGNAFVSISKPIQSDFFFPKRSFNSRGKSSSSIPGLSFKNKEFNVEGVMFEANIEYHSRPLLLKDQIVNITKSSFIPIFKTQF